MFIKCVPLNKKLMHLKKSLCWTWKDSIKWLIEWIVLNINKGTLLFTYVLFVQLSHSLLLKLITKGLSLKWENDKIDSSV